MAPGPSDLVADTKIRVEFDSEFTYRFTIQSGGRLRRREKKEAWRAEKALGEGASGSVWLHRCHVDGTGAELQAVKRIDKAKMASQELDWQKELEAIAKFSQRKYDGLFVDYIGWYESDTFVFIAMEYIEHGSLHTHLKGSLPESQAREITRQVAEGLCDLHAGNFVHRDLKPANILVARKAPDWWVKIGDFGISKRVHEDTSLRTTVGTRLFMAPETQMIYPPDMDDDMTLNYTERVDIWSLGVVAYYMLFHVYPFTIKNAFLPKYVRGAPLPFPQPVSSQISDFLRSSLAAHSFKRLSAIEVLECDWLQEDPSRLSVLTHQMSSLNVQGQGSEISSASTEGMPREPCASTVDPDRTERRRPEAFRGESSTVKRVSAPTSDSIYERNSRQRTSTEENMEDTADRMIKKPILPSSKMQTPTMKFNLPGSTHPEIDAIKWQRITGPGVGEESPVDDSGLASQEDQSAKTHYSEGWKHLQHEGFNQAMASFQEAVEEYNYLFGGRDTRTLESQHALGLAFLYMKEYTLAAEQFKKAARGRRITLGATDLATLNSEYSLCCTYWNAKEYEKAETGFRKLLEPYNEVFGPNSPDTHIVEVGLAENLFPQKKWDETEGIFRRVSEWQKENYGPLSPMTLRSQGYLGMTLLNLEKYEQARPIIEENVKNYREKRGASHPETLFMVHKMGFLWQDLDKTSDAAACFQEVVDCYRAIGQTGEELYLDSLFELGYTYWLKKNYKKAEGILKEAAQSQKAHWGTSEKTCKTLYRLGKTQFKLDKYHEASDTFQETVLGETMVLGAGDHQTLNSMYWLAYSFRRLKQPEQAEPGFRLVFETQKETLGFLNWDTLESLFALGEVLYELKRYEEAVERYREAMIGWSEYHGPTHKDTLYAMHRLGRAHHKAEEYDEAEMILKVLVKKQKSVAGSSGTKTLSAMDCLGWTLFRMKKHAEGEIVTRELVERRKKKLKANAPKTFDAIRALALHLEGQGKVYEAAPLLYQVMVARRKAYGNSHKLTKQCEREYQRCFSKMEKSSDDDSDETITSVSSVGAEVGHMPWMD